MSGTLACSWWKVFPDCHEYAHVGSLNRTFVSTYKGIRLQVEECNGVINVSWWFSWQPTDNNGSINGQLGLPFVQSALDDCGRNPSKRAAIVQLVAPVGMVATGCLGAVDVAGREGGGRRKGKGDRGKESTSKNGPNWIAVTISQAHPRLGKDGYIPGEGHSSANPQMEATGNTVTHVSWPRVSGLSLKGT